MSAFYKSFSRAIAVFAVGFLSWLAIVSSANHSILSMGPAHWVMVMGLFVMLFSATAFWTHKRSIAGMAYEDSRKRRRPSFIIPVISSITYMVFVLAWTGGNPAVWAMG